MRNIETHKYYSEEDDKEIWIDGKLTYTSHEGLENDDPNQVSTLKGKKCIQTVYMTDKGTVQRNHSDDSFYFTRNDNTSAIFIDGKLQIEDSNGDYNDFIIFANGVLAGKC